VKKMGIEWIIVTAVLGLGAGAGITAAIGGDDKSSEVQAQTAKQLSSLDILEPICSVGYLKNKGPDLCRELYCWAQTNSTTGEASGIACEAISNINNTVSIRALCEAETEEAAKAACYTLFRERK
jgi:hypothetical protein